MNMAPPGCYDIVIVGAGPVGLLLSTCLARWGYSIKHIDNRAEPTPTGRADGIQPRTLELLRNMGLKSKIMQHKPARVYEVAFWDPAEGGIRRTGTWASCPKFIDARYPFTTLLHQGFIERIFIEDLNSNGVDIQRPWTIRDFENDGQDAVYPVKVKLSHVEAPEVQETVRAKYLFSGEGAKSIIRTKLGIQIRHKDPISYVWGVMDGVVRTNFPDIKMKCTIHSDSGSIMVIPREANMVRLYIQLASSSDSDFDPRKTATAAQVQQKAKAILKPYYISWDTVDWYSVYPIGQGISDKYTLDNRIFMGGDACHTHSPKAGQGMNTAFLDALNLAWKLHHVEAGFASRHILDTYELERRQIAEDLLDFDSRYARLFSQKIPSASVVGQASQQNSGGSDSTNAADNAFVKAFKESCEFTSGYGVTYSPNMLNWTPSHPAASPLLLSYPQQTRLCPGRILPAATVTRVIDANVVHLEQEIPLNGSFRIFIFAGALSRPGAIMPALNDFARAALRPRSFLGAHLRRDIVSVSPHEQHVPHSRFVSLATVLATPQRSDVEIDTCLPPLLARYRGHVYADNLRDERVPDARAAAHAKMGFDAQRPGVVVVRPDGYVGCVARLVQGTGTVDALDAYFGVFSLGIGGVAGLSTSSTL